MSIFKTYKIEFNFTDQQLFILLHEHLLNVRACNIVNGTSEKASRKSFNDYIRRELLLMGFSGMDDYNNPEEGSETWNEANRLFFIWFRKGK